MHKAGVDGTLSTFLANTSGITKGTLAHESNGSLLEMGPKGFQFHTASRYLPAYELKDDSLERCGRGTISKAQIDSFARPNLFDLDRGILYFSLDFYICMNFYWHFRSQMGGFVLLNEGQVILSTRSAKRTITYRAKQEASTPCRTEIGQQRLTYV